MNEIMSKKEDRDKTHLVGASWSSMRPLIKEAKEWEASLTAAASLERVSFCIRSSKILTDCAFSCAVDMMNGMFIFWL